MLAREEGKYDTVKEKGWREYTKKSIHVYRVVYCQAQPCFLPFSLNLSCTV